MLGGDDLHYVDTVEELNSCYECLTHMSFFHIKPETPHLRFC